jgi:tRNA (mo5U34)-methyltransferase
MTVYKPFYRWLESVGQADWAEQLGNFTAERLADDFHGKMPLWQQALADLPSITRLY